jgi:hypothetical protein
MCNAVLERQYDAMRILRDCVRRSSPMLVTDKEGVCIAFGVEAV